MLPEGSSKTNKSGWALSSAQFAQNWDWKFQKRRAVNEEKPEPQFPFSEAIQKAGFVMNLVHNGNGRAPEYEDQSLHPGDVGNEKRS